MYRTLALTTAFAIGMSMPGLHPAAAAQQDPSLKGVLESVAPSIVTLRLVVKTEVTAQGRRQPAQESRREMQATVVTADGLVLAADGQFTGATRDMGMMSMKETVEDLKVVIGREDRKYDAFVVATDTKLHLAFIQIEGLGDRKLTPVDFAASVNPKVGDTAMVVSRLDSGYDYAPFFRSAHVGGKLSKPRKAWLLDSAAGSAGLPVFTAGGQVVGVITAIDSTLDDDQGGAPRGFMGMIQSMLMGGPAVAPPPFVLPARVVRGSVAQAVARAAEMAKERASKKSGEDEPGQDG